MEYPDNSRELIDPYNEQGHYDGEPFSRLDKRRPNKVSEHSCKQVSRDEQRYRDLRTWISKKIGTPSSGS